MSLLRRLLRLVPAGVFWRLDCFRITRRLWLLRGGSLMYWERTWLLADELAVIVPIPESLLDAPAYDLWADVPRKD